MNTFEIKNDHMIHISQTQTELCYISTPGLYCSGWFYRVDEYFENDKKIYALIGLAAYSFAERTIEVFHDDARVIFNFRHYSVCEKQEFINNSATDMLQYYMAKL